MFNRRHRFHGYGSLKAVYQRGQTVRGPLISLRFARREANKPNRVAVVVSRKVSKSAVVRNRIRRRVYEAARQSGAAVNSGTDLIFTVFSDQVAEMEAPKLQRLVIKLLRDAGLSDNV
jgi:ribonuclease P protein component